MKIQIKNFSTHQTAKVFALMMAVSSLLVFAPFGLITVFATPSTTPDGNLVMFLIMPFFQGVFVYLMVRFGLWTYNKLSPKIGGFEFEFEETNS